MATYVSLINLTNQGESDIRHTVDRANAFRKEASALGVNVKELYWTLGTVDGVVIFDAPDDKTATALMLNLGSKGSVRTQTLRAFDSDEMNAILKSMP